MIRFVLDASTALTWCFPDEHSRTTEQALDLLMHQNAEAIATVFWPLEVLNALLMGERRKRITWPVADAFLTDMRKLPVRLDSRSTDTRVVELFARRYALTACDAAYLELAQRQQLPLSTLDKDLLRAAPIAGIPLLGSSSA